MSAHRMTPARAERAGLEHPKSRACGAPSRALSRASAWRAERYRVVAATERLDDVVPARQPVLMLKVRTLSQGLGLGLRQLCGKRRKATSGACGAEGCSKGQGPERASCAGSPCRLEEVWVTCPAAPPPGRAAAQVDVEGYEPRVLQSARRLIATRQARHVFFEYSPGEGALGCCTVGWERLCEEVLAWFAVPSHVVHPGCCV